MRILRSLSVIALAAAARPSAAQLPSAVLPPARLGFTGGLNLSTFDGDGLGPTDSRRGFVGGIVAVTPFTAHFSTQLEALYSMKGMKSLSSSPQTYSVFKLDYVEIPLMLRVDAPMSEWFEPFAFTGPAADFKVSCGSDAVVNGNSTSASCDQILSSTELKFHTLDFGWVFGGGLGLDVHDRRVSLAARYEVGLRTITDPGRSKNRALSFMVSVEAPLPRRTRR